MNQRRLSTCLAALLIALAALVLTAVPTWACGGGVICLDADASGPAHDGQSWTTAYTSVQAALDWTNTHTATTYEIWLAEGVYYPDEGGSHVNNSRGEFFRIAWNNVQLYGGFAATETAREQRDWAAHPTVLSGDIDGNDSNTDGNFVAETWNDLKGNNAYHVLWLDGVTNGSITSATVLDGFTITGGNTNGDDWPGHNGGGLYCAGNAIGRTCSPTLIHIIFSGNQAYEFGGGMFNNGDSGDSSPSLTHVTFNGNYASSGGGIANRSQDGASSPALTNVTFSGNSAWYEGGGMYNSGVEGVSNPSLTNVTFSGNQAGENGGGMCNDGYRGESSPSLTNVTFNGNQARRHSGGGMYNYGGTSGKSNPSLTNVTFSGNQAGMYGGGMASYTGYDDNEIHPVLVNCILWGNTAPDGPQIYNHNAMPTVAYSNVQWPSGVYTGAGNLNVDPQFIAPISAAAAPTTTGNYRLHRTSPAIDAGNNFSVTVTTDLDGHPRAVDMPIADTGSGAAPLVDIGAYEAHTFYVDADASGAATGLSWTDALTNVQTALDWTNSHGSSAYEIWVAEGVYYPDEGGSRVDNDRNECFRIAYDNVQLYGGFAATETLRAQRDWRMHLTVLSGDIDRDSAPDHNAYHVLYLDGVTNESITGATILDGFTTTGGNADSNYPNDRGGGLYCAGRGSGHQCNPKLSHIIFSGNAAAASGGGMYNDGVNGESNPDLDNVIFKGNSATSGGGMLNDGNDGGLSSPTLTNVVFSGNAAVAGGGMYNDGNDGGVSRPTLINVTFSGNSAEQHGGGMYNHGLAGGISNPTLINCILWGNTAIDGLQIYNDNAAATVTHSDVQGGYTGAGNLNVDPQFVTPITATAAPTTTGDYRLQVTSPAIDAGNSFSVTAATDMDGLLRKVDSPYANNTGAGTPPVDMGAYELQLPRLSLAKSVAPAIAAPYRGLVTYTLTLHNRGDGIGIALILTDTLPAGVNFEQWLEQPANGLVRNGNAITWTGTLAPATGVTLTFTAQHIGDYRDVVVNTAHFSGAAQQGQATASFNVGAIYVDADATGAASGLTWADAYTNVQAALDWTNTHPAITYEIWVAEGVYYPDEGDSHVNNSRTEFFRVVYDNVQLYGGFAATETLRAQRDWTAHPTILSGDIDGNDWNTDTNRIAETWNDVRGSNAYHVLYLDGVTNESITGATVLDGFTITAGDAQGDSPDNDGGGLICAGNGSGHACSPTLSHLIFSGNSAGFLGGGLYSYGVEGMSSPALTHVTFNGNRSAGGGGMSNDARFGGVSSSTLTDVTFNANSAIFSGGGLENLADEGVSSPILTNVVFSGNRAGEDGGGGMSNWSNGWDEDIRGKSNPVLINVIFSGNSTTGAGGGMDNDSSFNSESDPSLTNVTFSGNSAERGGGMSNESGGIGAESQSTSNPVLTNVTFSGNSAEQGGGIYNRAHNGGESRPNLGNCILWGNAAGTGPQLYDAADGATTVSYSDVQWPEGVYTGTGNLNADPQFVAPTVASAAPTTTGNYRLQAASPAIDAGNSFSITAATDMDGQPRKVDVSYIANTGVGTPPVDMGAYEAQFLGFVLAKSVTPGAAAPYRGLVTYTLILRNVDAASNTTITLTDTLPDEVDFAQWITQPTGGIVQNGNAITWTGTLATATGVTLTFTARHTSGYGDMVINTAHFSSATQTGVATATHTVAPNYPPALNEIGNHWITLGASVAFTAAASDANGYPPLAYTLDAGSVGGITAGGAFTWTPAGVGVYTATVRVSDGELEDSETFSITVVTEPVHTLTVNVAGKGAVDIVPRQTGYISGTEVTLTAQPADGWQFTGWLGDLSGATSPATLAMNADKIIIATFTRAMRIYLPLTLRNTP